MGGMLSAKMSLQIIACLKQVPHPEHFSRLSLDPRTKTLIREGIPTITNPLDLHALEEGLRVKEKFPGRVIALSMGPPQSRETLEEALAMGADEAILLCHPALAGADTLATSFTLASAIQKLGAFDLILCGNETIDGGTGQVGPQLAEFLRIPHITDVESIEFKSSHTWIVRRFWEEGYIKIEVALPALLAVSKKINEPRLPTVRGIVEAASKPLYRWDLAYLGLTESQVGVAASPTRAVDIVAHKSQRKGKILSGSASETAKKAVQKLKEWGVL